MTHFDRNSINPAIMRGMACIKGTRVPVATILGMLAKGHSRERILGGYPDLKPEDIDAALEYASWRMSERTHQIA